MSPSFEKERGGFVYKIELYIEKPGRRQVKEDTEICRDRLKILFGLAVSPIVIGTVVQSIFARPVDHQVARPATIRLDHFLDAVCPGWVPWQEDGITGHGVQYIPGYGDMRSEYILVNGSEPAGINVQTIFLRSGNVLQIGGFRHRFLLLQG